MQPTRGCFTKFLHVARYADNFSETLLVSYENYTHVSHQSLHNLDVRSHSISYRWKAPLIIFCVHFSACSPRPHAQHLATLCPCIFNWIRKGQLKAAFVASMPNKAVRFLLNSFNYIVFWEISIASKSLSWVLSKNLLNLIFTILTELWNTFSFISK